MKAGVLPPTPSTEHQLPLQVLLDPHLMEHVGELAPVDDEWAHLLDIDEVMNCSECELEHNFYLLALAPGCFSRGDCSVEQY